MRRASNPHRVTREEIIRYYEDLTTEYQAYSGAALTWNFGIWEPDVRTHQAALLRGKEIMLRGVDVGPATRILDVGCGAGGFAIWCAKQLGCHVTGITLCAEHVELAESNAAESGVGDLCRFRVMDLNRLEFPGGIFDAVTNQESYCYAQPKRRFVQEVFRILAPGGVWSCIDFTVRKHAHSSTEAVEVQKVLRGFHIPSLVPLARIATDVRAAGFVDATATDLTAAALPTAGLIMRSSFAPLRHARLHPRRRVHSPFASEEANLRGHFEAGMAYSIGLHTGLFEYGFVRARKPARR